MPKYVKVYLSPELDDILEIISEELGISKSETVRKSIIDQAERYGIIQQRFKLSARAPIISIRAR